MNKKMSYKLYISLLLALLAALGNIPYGYRFAHTIFSMQKPYINFIGYIFAATATLANIALGSYSVMSLKKSDLFGNKYYVVLLSLLGATPIGFICFLGYLNLLPIFINIFLSINVSFINAGINIRAILNMLNAFRNIIKSLKKPIIEIIFRTTGFIAGLAVSTIGYVAATSSLFMLFSYLKLSESSAMQLSYSIAILTWIPSAALFPHSTQKILSDVYFFFFPKKNKKVSSENKYFLLFIIIFSLLSASSLTQMVVELFRPENRIPEFLKNKSMQFFIYHVLAPTAFFSSAAVNLFALRNLLKYIKK